MIKFYQVLVVASFVLSSAIGVASNGDFYCRSSDNFNLTGLGCVSCGAQKYFSDKGQKVVPSQKWIALLGTMAKQHAKIESDTDLQVLVISMMKDYGFCQKFISKKRAKKIAEQTASTSKDPSDFSDVGSEDWKKFIYLPITVNPNLSKDDLDEIGEYYGFDNSGILFKKTSNSENMNYLIMNSPDPKRSNFPKQAEDYEFATKYPTYNVGQSADQRRPSFLMRLKKALSGKDNIIVKDDENSGIANCLREIERMHEGPNTVLSIFTKSPAETGLFCKEMANACEIPANFCGSTTQSSKPKSPPPPPPSAPKTHQVVQ